jgi:hypothetical protein
VDVTGYTLIRRWKAADYRLEVFDTGRRDPQGRLVLAFRFFFNGRLMFEDRMGLSAVRTRGGNHMVGELLSFLSTKPGDTDPEYFAAYTQEQLDFVECHGDDLSCYAIVLEEGEDGGSDDEDDAIETEAGDMPPEAQDFESLSVEEVLQVLKRDARAARARRGRHRD